MLSWLWYDQTTDGGATWKTVFNTTGVFFFNAIDCQVCVHVRLFVCSSFCVCVCTVSDVLVPLLLPYLGC